ncbi:hypothetical protein ACT16_23165 [Mycobacterium heckeshornense]|nr:hypothetical protein ACT16_23165 [Mycobacterium heckeshornense]
MAAMVGFDLGTAKLVEQTRRPGCPAPAAPPLGVSGVAGPARIVCGVTRYRLAGPDEVAAAVDAVNGSPRLR